MPALTDMFTLCITHHMVAGSRLAKTRRKTQPIKGSVEKRQGH